MKTFVINLLKATYVSLKIIFIFSIFLLPWRIWWDNAQFLVKTYENKHFENKYLNSELKIMSWINLFLSGLIFLMYPIGIMLVISLFFKGFVFHNILRKMFFLAIFSYFSPLIWSLIKEMFSLSLLKFFKMENIETGIINIVEKQVTEQVKL